MCITHGSWPSCVFPMLNCMWLHSSSPFKTPLWQLRLKGGSAPVQTWLMLGNPTGSLAFSSLAFSTSLRSPFPKPFQGWAIRDWPGEQVYLDLYVLLSLTGCNYTGVGGCLGCMKRMNAWQQEVKRGEGAQDGGVNGFIHKAAAGAGCVSTAWILFCKPCAQPLLTQHGRWIKQAILKLFPSAEIAKGWQPDTLQITKSIFCTGKQGFNLSGIQESKIPLMFVCPVAGECKLQRRFWHLLYSF